MQTYRSDNEAPHRRGCIVDPNFKPGVGSKP
jgi:hypothetical protein